MKTRIARRSYLAAGAVAIVGCGSVLGASAGDPTVAPARLTEQVAPSLLVVAPGPADMDQLLRQVVTTAARPREDLEVLEAGSRGRALLASQSPPPASVVASGKPAPPGPGASSYQQARYQRDLTHWRGQMAEAQRLVATRTRAADEAWIRSLRLQSVVAGPPPSQDEVGLRGECAIAASVISGLVDQAGGRFGDNRRVVVAIEEPAAGTS